MLIIGSHVSFKKDDGLVGSVKEALGYGANTFMFYTGAPQNTNRTELDLDNIKLGWQMMKDNNIDIANVIVHAPYIVNLANTIKEGQYDFSIKFLIEECKRCEILGIKRLVLHPGSHVGLGVDVAINNIANALNIILEKINTTILLEVMAGKGSEVGKNFLEIKQIIDKIDEKDKIGICLDTCHLSDAGYDINNFDEILKKLKDLNLLDKVLCIHINDSKNPCASHKDRHENIGFGHIGFKTLIDIIYNKQLENIPKILETPYVGEYPPYKFEIEMIKNKKFNSSIYEDIKNYYKKQD